MTINQQDLRAMAFHAHLMRGIDSAIDRSFLGLESR